MKNNPKWLDDAVFYEIYLPSFCDSNGDGIGDIKGAISKLDYIRDSGFSAIWLNPWFASGFRDGGYDITDFYSVDPRYGTNEDAKLFCRECHQRGIKVILDLVIGHTSIDHPWFVESCKNEKNRYSDLFIWSPQLYWRGDPADPGDYYVSGWSSKGAYKANFFAVQPAFNFGYNEVRFPWEMSWDSEIPRKNRELMKNIMRYWLDFGCDGFRVDTACCVIKRDPEYKRTREFWREVREMLEKEYPEAILVSEWFEPQYALDCGFHIDFANSGKLFRNDDWLSLENSSDPVIMADQEASGLPEWLSVYLDDLQKTNQKGYMAFCSGNHDRWRMRHYFGMDNMVVNMALIMTMPGIPFIYYGDEIGMRYLPGLSTEGSGSRGGSRSPMQWDNSVNHGFSKAAPEKLYLPTDTADDAPVVSDALAGENRVYTEVCKLTGLRKNHAALHPAAGLEFLHGTAGRFPLVYRRKNGKDSCIIFLNPCKDEKVLSLQVADENVLWNYNGVVWADGKVIMPPVSAAIVSENK